MSNQYILRSFQLNVPYNSYLDKAYSVFELIFAFIVASKAMFIVFLQAIYISFSKHLVQSDYIVEMLELENTSNVSYVYLKSLKIIDMLLSHLGAYNRRSGTTALFCQSIWASVPIIFFLFDIINYKQIFKLIDNNEFICFLREPQEANKRKNEVIDIILKQLVESNLNYSQYVLDENEIESDNKVQRNLIKRSKTFADRDNMNLQGNSLEQQTNSKVKTYIDDEIFNRHLINRSKRPINKLTLKRPALEFIIEESKSLLLKKMNHNYKREKVAKYKVVNSQLDELANQYTHLIKLIKDKSNIYPPNRTEKWRMISHKRWFHLFLVASCFLFIMMHSCTKIAIEIGFNQIDDSTAMVDSPQNVGSQRVKLSLIKRENIIEQHLFVWFAINWFIMPITLLISCLFDQARHLSHLKKKFKKFIAKSYEFKELEAIQKSFHLDNYEFSSVLDKLEDASKFEFDNEAINLYISFIIFCNELGSTLELARYILNQNVCFIIFSVLPILFYIRHVPSSDYKLYVIFYIGVMLVVNGAFYTCGSLNASCISVSNLVWEILASVMQPGTPTTKDNGNFKATKKSKNILRGDNVRESSTRDIISLDSKLKNVVGAKSINSLSIRYNCKTRSTISPHTLSLWHKLAKNHELLVEKFECQILGLLKLEYTSIIKFNFWLISLVLIFLTVQH